MVWVGSGALSQGCAYGPCGMAFRLVCFGNKEEKRMGEDLILREEEPRRDCMTCKFEPVESDRYPCCECGIRCHYSPDYRRGEENG